MQLGTYEIQYKNCNSKYVGHCLRPINTRLQELFDIKYRQLEKSSEDSEKGPITNLEYYQNVRK